jgi:hypothetical protein
VGEGNGGAKGIETWRGAGIGCGEKEPRIGTSAVGELAWEEAGDSLDMLKEKLNIA